MNPAQVMAKARIGHIVEAQILQAIGCDFIDESEVLTPADPSNHIAKHAFRVPFVCGCKDLGEALRRISEGAAMIRTKVNVYLSAHFFSFPPFSHL
jgi:pyridoxal 5'-phosphate synthase pdxS subunit